MTAWGPPGLLAVVGSAGIMVDREDIDDNDDMEDMEDAVRAGDGAELDGPLPADSLEK